MNRSRFFKSVLGLGLFSTWACQTDRDQTNYGSPKSDTSSPEQQEAVKLLKEELKAAWLRSEMMTLKNVEQMPPQFFTFKYTKEAMTFAEQWRHCVIYTCGQLAGLTGVKNPYKGVKLPVQMSKENIIKELKNMYTFIRTSIEELSSKELLAECKFAGDTIPVWRLFYALENHIIHHRGQCIVYLRLNGIRPKGYYGW
ncbi:MAG: DinB family protein [Bacteroidota bacterium]